MLGKGAFKTKKDGMAGGKRNADLRILRVIEFVIKNARVNV